MGLDLGIYTEKEINGTTVEEEICYGRKTWAIAYFFMKRCCNKEEYVFPVTKKAWDEFISKVKPYAENENFVKMIEEYNEFSDEASWEIENIFECFLDEALENDEPYTLGPAWEARVVIDWYEANETIQKLFNDDAPVLMYVSY